MRCGRTRKDILSFAGRAGGSGHGLSEGEHTKHVSQPGDLATETGMIRELGHCMYFWEWYQEVEVILVQMWR